jgi:hypothetical protein
MLDFFPLHFFGEDISACNRSWTSTCDLDRIFLQRKLSGVQQSSPRAYRA